MNFMMIIFLSMCLLCVNSQLVFFDDITTGNTPNPIASFDFNNDGNIDIAVGSVGDGTLSIYLGFGNGSFVFSDTQMTGGAVSSSPGKIVIGDFNNDMNPDIIVVNQGTDNFSLFLNLGSGIFALPIHFIPQTSPVGACTGDFNNDNNLDVAISNAGSNTVSIFLGNGLGSFIAPSNFPTNINTGHIECADVTNDNIIDIVVIHAGLSDTMLVLIGNGFGSFLTGNSYSTGTGPFELKIVDINFDQNMDVIVTNAGSDTFSVFIGLGSGSFDPPVDYVTQTQPLGLSIADMDGDQILDVIVVNKGSNSFSLYLGSTSGTFLTPSIHSLGILPQRVTIADVNNNGKSDVMITITSGNVISVYRNTFLFPIPQDSCPSNTDCICTLTQCVTGSVFITPTTNFIVTSNIDLLIQGNLTYTLTANTILNINDLNKNSTYILIEGTALLEGDVTINLQVIPTVAITIVIMKYQFRSNQFRNINILTAESCVTGLSVTSTYTSTSLSAIIQPPISTTCQNQNQTIIPDQNIQQNPERFSNAAIIGIAFSAIFIACVMTIILVIAMKAHRRKFTRQLKNELQQKNINNMHQDNTTRIH